MVSLDEASGIRRLLHARKGQCALPNHPDTALSLRMAGYATGAAGTCARFSPRETVVRLRVLLERMGVVTGVKKRIVFPLQTISVAYPKTIKKTVAFSVLLTSFLCVRGCSWRLFGRVGVVQRVSGGLGLPARNGHAVPALFRLRYGLCENVKTRYYRAFVFGEFSRFIWMSLRWIWAILSIDWTWYIYFKTTIGRWICWFDRCKPIPAVTTIQNSH